MSLNERQIHLGVFVLGTGNHSAGWRYEGAATSHLELPVMQEIARIAERGKFDLLFISRFDGHGPGRPPLVPVPLRTDDLDHRALRGDDAYRAWSDSLNEFLGAVQRRADFRLDRPSERRPGGLERGHEFQRQGRPQLQPRRTPGARTALRPRPGIRRCRHGAVGLLGRGCDRRRQGNRPSTSRRRQGAPAQP